MSDEDKRKAKELGGRAARQTRAAAKNTGRAAKVAAQIAAEAAGDKVEEVDAAADEAVEAVEEAVRPAVKTGTQLILSPLGKSSIGFIVGGAFLTYAIQQARLAWAESKTSS